MIKIRRAVWISLAVTIFLVAAAPAADLSQPACEHWVAPGPEGDDANPGTSERPWATLQHASKTVEDDACTVWFNPGVYQGGHRLNRRFDTPTTFKSVVPYQAVLENYGAVISISGGKNIRIEGFEIRHAGPGSSPLVVAIDRSDSGWSENIVLANNIIHDSYNNDLLKIYNGCKQVLVENNLFYNQGDSEEHMDVNSVVEVTIRNNIFFNSFESSGRPDKNLSKQFIVIKDSNGSEDGLIGSKNIRVQQNVFLNWEGQEKETFIQVGLDGKPYIEAENVFIENNLLIGNTANQIGSVFGVRGAKDVYVSNNSVVGDFPALSFAFRVTVSDLNPNNQNVYFVNNIWADPTGTMGADLNGKENEFSDGDPAETENLILLNNLYWNGGAEIPNGDLLSPLTADPLRLVSNPLIRSDQADLVLPFWDGQSFISGNQSIREEFVRLVSLYGRISKFSPAVDAAHPDFAPADDILGNPRIGGADIGAYENVDWFLNWLRILGKTR